MQPPRTRRPRTRRSIARRLTALTINVMSLATALMLARLVALSVGDTTRFVRLLRRGTDPLVWPLHLLPPARAEIVGRFTAGDTLTLIAILLIGSLALGVIAGWEAEGRP